MPSKIGGWTGRTLRVDLSTGKISREDTIEKYKDYLGGTGVGYKVLWDEVPSGTKPFDPGNKIIFAVGVLAGTGAPCSGRTAVTTLFPTCWPKPLVGSGHMGGHFAAQLKYAGWDAVIIEGQADRPVWLAITDSQVEIKDARTLWGQGIRRTNLEITQLMGPECVVAAIGQAGENMVPLSTIINAVSHSAGGVGAIMGAKKLKAIAVQGTGSVKIAADKNDWEKLVKYHLSLLGANNQHVVPNTPQPWSEYHNPSSRWVASPGRSWGAAAPPIDVGTCDPHDLNHIAHRTNSAAFYLGPLAWKHTVRGNGCTGCPIRCHTMIKVPAVAEKYGIRDTGQNTCVGLVFGRQFFKTLPGGPTGQANLEACMVGMHLADDLGIWSNYQQLQRDFVKLYYDGTIKNKIGGKEFKELPWDKYEQGDPSFLMDLLPRIAFKQGELGVALGLGTGYLLERWGIKEEEWTRDRKMTYWKMGHPKHHSSEDDGQCGVIINTQYNRDCQCHSHTNFIYNGLPLDVQKLLAAEVWGSPDAVDAPNNFRPMNIHKAYRAKWAIIRKELHDSLSLCNWMGPWVASPLKERSYRGDDSLESKFYSLITGDAKTKEELDMIGERIFTLHRALTIRDMGTQDMRGRHDLIPDWVYGQPGDPPPFTKGSQAMDREDIKKAMDAFYEIMGWDKNTGAPLPATYQRLGLKDVASKLPGAVASSDSDRPS
ncbi:MAG: aldehyde ferredoxin oxidoreductase [Deltaproteobacteria bacterium]|nr:aldehyde ferredoxin oxidoreductase [Deltaproteobacteria bacterium]